MKAKYVFWGVLAAAGALFPWMGGADVPDGRLAYTDDEIRAILAHGPWPVPGKKDPSNRVSGKREAMEFGERLFFDTRLSGSGKFSCGTCHVPERNWTDNQTRGAAVAQMDRNTPTLMNMRLGRWFGWDGASDSLWAQSIRPMLDPRELGASARHVADVVRNDEQFSCRYRKAFGAPPSADRRRGGAGGHRQGARRVPGNARQRAARPSTSSATRSRAASASRPGPIPTARSAG